MVSAGVLPEENLNLSLQVSKYDLIDGMFSLAKGILLTENKYELQINHRQKLMSRSDICEIFSYYHVSRQMLVSQIYLS